MLVEFRLIGLGNQSGNESAFLYDAIGTQKRVFANRVEHNIDIFGHVFEFRLCVIDRHVRTELLEQILISRRCRRNHFCAARLGNLNSKTSHAP